MSETTEDIISEAECSIWADAQFLDDLLLFEAWSV